MFNQTSNEQIFLNHDHRGERRGMTIAFLWFWLHNNEAMSDIPIICDQKLAEKFDPPIP